MTGITKRLLDHWHDPEEFESRRFFFCQLEAAETLIWLAEAPPSERVGIDIPSDGGSLKRLCAKMATGSGKTVVMAMVIAWHVLNKVANPRDVRFAKNILVVAPGLTVRSRLAVLKPSHPENYYEEFRVVPPALRDKLRRGRVVIRNWHALNWETEERIAKKRGVDKRGAKSDAAYVRDVLGEMANTRNLLVVNDEAHHAWRVPASGKVKGVLKSTVEEATKWVGGLDRIHRARGILACYDFSATPFVPSGKRSSEEALFGWIVSDFGLNDAIESGLVKTPRVVIRDDAMADTKTYKSRLYHIYQDPEVKDDLNRPSQAGGTVAGPSDERVLPARLRLAGDRQGLDEEGCRHPSCDDYRRQPDRDGRSYQTRVRPQADSHRRTLRPGAHTAYRLEGFWRRPRQPRNRSPISGPKMPGPLRPMAAAASSPRSNGPNYCADRWTPWAAWGVRASGFRT